MSGRSHSSVHADLSIRAGLPVSERDRSVSAEVAREELLLHHRVGLGLLGGEPHRSAPHALRAERHGRRHLAAAADAAGAEHRDGGDRVDDLGDEHHRADLAGVAAGLGALGDDEVDPGLHVALGVHRLAGQGADQAPSSFTRSIMNCGGGPSALATNAVRWASAMSSCGPAAVAENGAASERPRPRPRAVVVGGSSGTS